MNKRKLPHVFFVVFFQSICSTSGYSQGVEYILPKEAVNEFAPNVFHGRNENNTHSWVEERNGRIMPMPYPEVPSSVETFYVVYRYKFELSIWFGPGDRQWQKEALNKLIDLREAIIRTGELDPNDVRVFPVIIPANNCLKYGWRDGNIVVNDLTADFVRQKNLLNDLRGKADKIGKELSKKYGKGGKGPLPGYFSEWFVRTIRIIGEIFFPKLTKLIERALVAAYLVAPELFDRVASILGQLQDALTPDKLDRILDDATWIAGMALELYDYSKAILDIMSDPNFLELVKHLKVEHALKALKTVGVSLPPQVETFLGAVVPGNFSELTRELFEKNVKRYAVKYAAREALKRSGVRVLKDLDPEKAYEAIKNGKFDQFVKNEIKNEIKKQASKYAGRYGEAAQLAIDGKIAEATKRGIAIEVQRQTGLPVEDIEKMYNRLERGDINTDEVLKNAAAEAARRALLKAGLPPEIINAFAKNGAAGVVSALAAKKGINFSADEISAILNGKKQKELLEKAKGCLKKVGQINLSASASYDDVNRALLRMLEEYARIAEVIPSRTRFVPSDAFKLQKAHDMAEFLKAVADMKEYADQANYDSKNMGPEAAHAMYRGDADAAYPKLMDKFAEKAKMSSPDAVSKLKNGKAEEAFELELKNRALARADSLRQELTTMVDQRMPVLRESVQALKKQFSPEELDKIMIRARMKPRR